jgi:hypothetical protein
VRAAAKRQFDAAVTASPAYQRQLRRQERHEAKASAAVETLEQLWGAVETALPSILELEPRRAALVLLRLWPDRLERATRWLEEQSARADELWRQQQSARSGQARAAIGTAPLPKPVDASGVPLRGAAAAAAAAAAAKEAAGGASAGAPPVLNRFSRAKYALLSEIVPLVGVGEERPADVAAALRAVEQASAVMPRMTAEATDAAAFANARGVGPGSASAVASAAAAAAAVAAASLSPAQLAASHRAAIALLLGRISTAQLQQQQLGGGAGAAAAGGAGQGAVGGGALMPGELPPPAAAFNEAVTPYVAQAFFRAICVSAPHLAAPFLRYSPLAPALDVQACLDACDSAAPPAAPAPSAAKAAASASNAAGPRISTVREARAELLERRREDRGAAAELLLDELRAALRDLASSDSLHLLQLLRQQQEQALQLQDQEQQQQQQLQQQKQQEDKQVGGGGGAERGAGAALPPPPPEQQTTPLLGRAGRRTRTRSHLLAPAADVLGPSPAKKADAAAAALPTSPAPSTPRGRSAFAAVEGAPEPEAAEDQTPKGRLRAMQQRLAAKQRQRRFAPFAAKGGGKEGKKKEGGGKEEAGGGGVGGGGTLLAARGPRSDRARLFGFGGAGAGGADAFSLGGADSAAAVNSMRRPSMAGPRQVVDVRPVWWSAAPVQAAAGSAAAAVTTAAAEEGTGVGALQSALSACAGKLESALALCERAAAEEAQKQHVALRQQQRQQQRVEQQRLERRRKQRAAAKAAAEAAAAAEDGEYDGSGRSAASSAPLEDAVDASPPAVQRGLSQQQRADAEETATMVSTKLWFSLLEVFYVNSSDGIVEPADGAAAEALREVRSECVRVTLTRMAGMVPLRAILRKVSSRRAMLRTVPRLPCCAAARSPP